MLFRYIDPMNSVIETERLFIREFVEADIDRWYEITSDSETMSFWPSPFSYDKAESWVKKTIQNYTELGCGRYALIEKESSTLIGDCGFFKLEILGKIENDLGYIISKEHWGQGFATEAAKACLGFGINSLGMKRVITNMETSHQASKRVAEKLGFSIQNEFKNERNRNKNTYLLAYEVV